jgi:hypothetical protein
MITKSKFKLGLDCIQKLRHYSNGLPSTLTADNLLSLLAEGGGAVEALQRVVEPPHWVGPDGGAEKAPESLARIKDAVVSVTQSGKSLSLYEVTIVHGNFMARIDLLRVCKGRIELVEIKATSWKPPTPERPLGEILKKDNKGIMSGWVPYVQDLAFQYELLTRWLKDHADKLGVTSNLPVIPKLLLIKSGGKAGQADRLASFHTRYAKDFRGNLRPEVEYSGPKIKSTDLLVEVEASREVELILGNAQAHDPAFKGCGISECMRRMEMIVIPAQWPKSADSLCAKCKKCEYRDDTQDRSGVVRCWGADVDATPAHILKLAYLSDAQVSSAIALCSNPAEATLTALPEIDLQERQKNQWRYTLSGQIGVKDSFSKDRFSALDAPAQGPVYFLDFETSSYPIPSRVGGEPYQLVPFQFEGHFLPSRDDTLDKRVLLPGFLDLAGEDPRRAMARALVAQFGTSGPIYHWSIHEKTVITQVMKSIAAEQGGPDDSQLVTSCQAIIDRLVDLMEIAKENITLPETNGSYSIKKLLPVIWKDPVLRKAFARGQAPKDTNFYEDPHDPYQSLSRLDQAFTEALGQGTVQALMHDEEGAPEGLDFAIKNGGLAMLYYHYVRLFGGAERQDIQRQFQQYCQLDSAAMVMAYDYLRRVRA